MLSSSLPAPPLASSITPLSLQYQGCPALSCKDKTGVQDSLDLILVQTSCLKAVSQGITVRTCAEKRVHGPRAAAAMFTRNTLFAPATSTELCKRSHMHESHDVIS
ncbi:hypothetical protein WJX77_006061 [Trebouxia sp. C0004]